MKIQRTALALIIVLGVLVTLPFFEESQIISIAKGVGSGDYPAPPTGDWVIETQPTVVEHEIIILNGSLLVRNGASLTLRNVTLKINSSTGSHFRIEVESGSTLTIEENSTITAVNPANSWYLVANDGSSIDLVNSTFSYVGWEPGTNGDHSGIWLNTDGATVVNCTFDGNYYGMYLYRATNSLITGNVILHSNDSGIHLEESTNNNISSNYVTDGLSSGISLDYSPDNIVHHNIIANLTKYGIYLGNSPNTTVVRNELAENKLAGVMVNHSPNCTVQNNFATGGEFARQELGIAASASSNSTIEQNQLTRHLFGGVRLENSPNSTVRANNVTTSINNAIGVINSANSTVIENNVTDSSDHGIQIYQSDFCNVSQNFVTETLREGGLSLVDSENCSVSENRLVFNNYGMELEEVANCTISANLVTNNFLSGIVMRSLRNCVISGNRISNNENGTDIAEMVDSVVFENEIRSNKLLGIHLRASTGDTILWDNHLAANGQNNAVDDNGTNQWDNGSHGNWWYDYSGVDAGGDGLGDAPYLVPGAGLAQDQYPRFISQVPDRMPPLIPYIPALTFPEGYPGINITVRATEAAPATFLVYRNGAPWATGPWNGSEIVVPLQTLPVGSYNFTLVLSDTANNLAIIMVWIKVETAYPPWLDPAPDVSFDEGSSGNSVDWSLGDTQPGNFSVYLNDTLVGELNWSATPDLPVSIHLSYSVSRLPDGVFSLQLVASNILGLAASDTVQALVMDTTPPEVSAKVTINRTSTALLSAPAEGMVTIQLTGNAEAYWYNIEGVDTVNRTVDDPVLKILTEEIDATTTALTIERTKDLVRSLPPGEYTLHVYGSDLAGNIGYMKHIFTLEPGSSSEPSQSDPSSEYGPEASSASGGKTEPSANTPSFGLLGTILAICVAILPVKRELRKRKHGSEM